jgi:hypothetical protein
MIGPKGYDLRNFECDRCDHVMTVTVATDPMKSGAMGWLAGKSEAANVNKSGSTN